MTIPRTPPGGTRGTVFRVVARLRMGDAEVLFEQSRHLGAIYLAGYAIECHLKYAVCKGQNCTYLPASLEVHDWETLVSGAGLRRHIEVQRGMDAIYSALVEQWGPALR
jgi:hypothetical protein